jgi:hypothetical protein
MHKCGSVCATHKLHEECGAHRLQLADLQGTGQGGGGVGVEWKLEQEDYKIASAPARMTHLKPCAKNHEICGLCVRYVDSVTIAEGDQEGKYGRVHALWCE